jgi:hypothetical protein
VDGSASALAHAWSLLWRSIDVSGGFGLLPAFLFAGVIVAGAFADAPEFRAGLRASARLALPTLASFLMLSLGVAFRTRGHTETGRVVGIVLHAILGLALLSGPWIVWRAKEHRAFAALVVGFELVYTVSAWTAASMSVADDWM